MGPTPSPDLSPRERGDAGDQRPPLRYYQTLFESLEPAELQARFLRTLLELQNVERGSLWVKEGEHYRCIEAAGYQSERIRGATIPADRPSIVGWVIEHGEMTMAEAGRDRRHHQAIEEGLEEKSSLILGFPLVLRGGRVYGAVEIIDTSSGGRRLKLDSAYLDNLRSLVAIGAIALGNALAYADQVAQTEALRRIVDEGRAAPPMIGQSAALLAVLRTAEAFARTDFPVLITGESGTGKELVARQIHHLGRRRGKPFLVQNCSAIPESLLESELFGYRKGAFTGASEDRQGLFEAASGGTVFLDEIGDMPLALQARILRVVQDNEVKPLGVNEARPVDVRLIAATHRDLERAVAAQQFREDLYYRLRVLPLVVPPLRQRREDIPHLLRHYLQRYSRQLGVAVKSLAPAAVEALVCHPWPGNVREVENLVRYLIATVPGAVVELDDLPPPYDGSAGPTREPSAPAAAAAVGQDGPVDLTGYSWEELERAYVLALLQRTRWMVGRAAELAGVKRTTFGARMRKLGIRRRPEGSVAP